MDCIQMTEYKVQSLTSVPSDFIEAGDLLTI